VERVSVAEQRRNPLSKLFRRGRTTSVRDTAQEAAADASGSDVADTGEPSSSEQIATSSEAGVPDRHLEDPARESIVVPVQEATVPFVWSATGRVHSEFNSWRDAFESSGESDVNVIAEWATACPGLEDALSWRALRADAETAGRLIAAGMTLSRAESWRSVGIELDEMVAWEQSGLSPQSASLWRSAGIIDAPTAAYWVEHASHGASPPDPEIVGAWERGVDHKSDLWGSRADWVARSVGPREATYWTEFGCTPPGLDELARNGFTLDSLLQRQERSMIGFGEGQPPYALSAIRRKVAEAIWRAAGWDVREACLLIDGNVPLSEANDWRSIEVSVARLLVWRELIGSPVDALEWITRNFHEPDFVARWMQQGFTPHDASEWIKAGFDNPEKASAWFRTGFAPTFAAALRARNLQVTEAATRLDVVCRDSSNFGRIQLLRGLGLTDDEATQVIVFETSADVTAGFIHTAGTRTSLNDWRSTGIPVWELPGWSSLFPDEPTEAAFWHRGGVSANELHSLHRWQGFPLRPAPGRRWSSQGRSPREILARPNLPSAPKVDPPPQSVPPATARSLQYTQPPAPAPRASTTVVAPVPPRKLAAREWDNWLTAGKGWMKSAGVSQSRHRDFLRVLFDEGLNWAEPTSNPFPWHHSDEWLEELLARAESLLPYIRREPLWPVAFKGEVTLVMTVENDWATAWVGVDSTGVLVSFRPSDFELRSYKSRHAARIGVGLAISWYLDCCVSLKNDHHPHLDREGNAAPNRGLETRGEGANRAPTYYVPTVNFRRHSQQIAAGTLTAPKAHRVKGHIRTLGADREPSDHARSQAPAHLRPRLGPRDTFVRSHTRGGIEAARFMDVHLSRYSSLAEALGMARRG
jgi:hypothetical protein